MTEWTFGPRWVCLTDLQVNHAGLDACILENDEAAADHRTKHPGHFLLPECVPNVHDHPHPAPKNATVIKELLPP